MKNYSIAVIKLAGELDVGRKDEIHAVLSLPADASAVLLDFSETAYADSTALAELLRLRGEAETAGVRVAILTGPGNRRLSRLLAYAGLPDAFAVFEERSSALNYLGAVR